MTSSVRNPRLDLTFHVEGAPIYAHTYFPDSAMGSGLSALFVRIGDFELTLYGVRPEQAKAIHAACKPCDECGAPIDDEDAGSQESSTEGSA